MLGDGAAGLDFRDNFPVALISLGKIKHRNFHKGGTVALVGAEEWPATQSARMLSRSSPPQAKDSYSFFGLACTIGCGNCNSRGCTSVLEKIYL
jgi:hypothetical protein